METLKNKIDFTLIFEVKNANPNGDPMFGNRPRVNYEEFGEVSDVCLKRKIRNRLMQMGEDIYVVSQDDSDDFDSLKARFDDFDKQEGVSKKVSKVETFREAYSQICNRWLDVRTFGQVFAFGNFSLGVRGAMSIQSAFSIDKVEINSIQITKSVNSESKKGTSKDSSTMGMKHRIDYAVYRTNGSINTHFAEKNGLNEDDVAKIKEAIKTIFENNVSSARPEGSMRVVGLIWWTHDSLAGNTPSYKLYDAVQVVKKDGVYAPSKLGDYSLCLSEESQPSGVTREIVINEFDK